MLHFINPHFVDKSLQFNVVVDLDKTHFIHGPWNYNCTSTIAQLNHYNSKTWPEFKAKIKRGRADMLRSQQPYSSSDFYKHNFNDIEDTTALDFYMKACAQK